MDAWALLHAGTEEEPTESDGPGRTSLEEVAEEEAALLRASGKRNRTQRTGKLRAAAARERPRHKSKPATEDADEAADEDKAPRRIGKGKARSAAAGREPHQHDASRSKANDKATAATARLAPADEEEPPSTRRTRIGFR